MSTRASQLRHRLSKIRAMSARELAQRVHYRLLVVHERRLHRRNALATPDRLRRAVRFDDNGGAWQQQLLATRRASAARFLPGVHQRHQMGELFRSRFTREMADTLAQAALAREARFQFFGRDFKYEGPIDWQADPVTHQRWPSLFHADVPIHHGDIGCGDVKHVWELSRQQYLVDLAKAHFLTGSAADLASMRALVRSWIAGNPYATGVNWSCALEPAFRSLSWLWAYHLTRHAIDDDFHLEWLEGFYDHARFIDRHLEHYSSPFNHLIGEAAALYLLGTCFHEFTEAAGWRQRGRAVLVERLAAQFYDDGGSVEQSTFYHHATVGFYLLAALVARANGDELPKPVWLAIERGIEFSMQVMQPDGTMPAIGGADDGRPIRMEHTALWDFRAYQSIGAVLYGRPDFKAAAARFYEDALWMLGVDGLTAYDALDSRPHDSPSRALPASGYYVLRSHWSSHSDYVCFDCGEQAAGIRPDGVPNSMHGHADCLSLVAWLRGRRVLVDSGFYAYNCGGDWETHFRETAAHSTARVDGRDQARHLGKMAWSHGYRASLEGQMLGPGDAWVVGSHDGYLRAPVGVTHRRAVWLRNESYIVIVDEFTGSSGRDVEVNYQFAPGELLLDGPQSASLAGRLTFQSPIESSSNDRHVVDVLWSSRLRWTPRVVQGGPLPSGGWIAPSLGVRQPAPRLTLTARTSEPRTTMVTILAHRLGGARRLHVASGDAVLASIVGSGYADWIAVGGVSEGGPLTTDALAAACRVQNGAVGEPHRVGGSQVHVDRQALVHLTETLVAGDAR